MLTFAIIIILIARWVSKAAKNDGKQGPDGKRETWGGTCFQGIMIDDFRYLESYQLLWYLYM